MLKLKKHLSVIKKKYFHISFSPKALEITKLEIWEFSSIIGPGS